MCLSYPLFHYYLVKCIFMTNDMTVGRPIYSILKMTLPVMAGNLFQQFYSMADTMIVETAGGFILSLFLSQKDASVISLATEYLRIVALFLPAFGTIMIYRRHMRRAEEDLARLNS